MLGLELRYMEQQLCHGYVGGCAAAPHSSCWCCCCLLPMLLVAGRVVLLLLLLELFFSFVSATRYKTGYDHILLGDLICMFFFVGLVFSFSSSLSSRSNTSLNFWSSFGCCFCCCCCCVIFLGIVGCHTEQIIFQYANIFAKKSLCFFFVVDWSPSIKRRVARLSGYFLPKWWVIQSRGVLQTLACLKISKRRLKSDEGDYVVICTTLVKFNEVRYWR